MKDIESRYLDGSYLAENPDWDRADSAWKAGLVLDVLRRQGISPASVCDVGCGAGAVLASIRHAMPDCRLVGYDIAPGLQRFWDEYAALGIEFHVTEVPPAKVGVVDVMLVLDVIEHLRDPFRFLRTLHDSARWFVFHIPLDLSAATVARESPLLLVRRKVGHIHYFTKSLALQLLRECGFEVVMWRYSGAAFTAPNPSLSTRVARLPRRLAFWLAHDLGARLLGGETLLVVARVER